LTSSDTAEADVYHSISTPLFSDLIAYSKSNWREQWRRSVCLFQTILNRNRVGRTFYHPEFSTRSI